MTHPLTYDQARDRAAELLGWNRLGYDEPNPSYRGLWWHPDGRQRCDIDHPIPDTLDAIARLFYEHLPGWTWTRSAARWRGLNERDDIAVVLLTGDTLAHEKHDRLMLFIACWEAEKGGKAQ